MEWAAGPGAGIAAWPVAEPAAVRLVALLVARAAALGRVGLGSARPAHV